ncbi:MAG: hypothetical protein QW035_00270 [Candidatus Anstonellales archaeon]
MKKEKMFNYSSKRRKNFVAKYDLIEEERTITIIYRENDLYKKIVQKLSEELEKKGYYLNLKEIPKEFIEEDIHAYLENRKFAGVMICDKTIKEILYRIPHKNKEKLSSMTIIDDVINKVISEELERAMKECKINYWLHDDEDYKHNYKRILAYLFTKFPEKKPKKIYIVANRLKDHFSDRLSDLEIGNKIAEWTSELDPEIETKVVTGSVYPKKGCWILGDRHYITYSSPDKCIFRLPPENLYEDLKDILDINIDIEGKTVKRISQPFKYKPKKGKKIIERVELSKKDEELAKVLKFFKIVDNVLLKHAPKLGYDYLKEKRLINKDHCLGVWSCETGSSYGFDTLYLISKEGEEGKCKVKELINTSSTKGYIYISNIEENNEKFVIYVRIEGYGNSEKRTIELEKNKIEYEIEDNVGLELDEQKYQFINEAGLKRLEKYCSQSPISKKMFSEYIKKLKDISGK